MEINGSRNFRHIRRALRAAQRAACLALPRGYRPRGSAFGLSELALFGAQTLRCPLGALDAVSNLSQIFIFDLCETEKRRFGYVSREPATLRHANTSQFAD